MAVIKNDNSGSANTAENTLLTNLQTPARNSETINTSIEKEKGHGVVPIPLVRGINRGQRAWHDGKS